jgi:hypothetical protein
MIGLVYKIKKSMIGLVYKIKVYDRIGVQN